MSIFPSQHEVRISFQLMYIDSIWYSKLASDLYLALFVGTGLAIQNPLCVLAPILEVHTVTSLKY